MTFQPSPYQQAIFNFIASGRGSCIVRAVAGSGKTTTLVGPKVEEGQQRPPCALDYIPNSVKPNDVAFIAFNKSIVETLVERVDEKYKKSIRTFHSMGFSAYRYFQKNCRVDDKKVDAIIRNSLPEHQVKAYGSYVRRMVGLAKSAGIGYLVPDTLDHWWEMRDYFDIHLDVEGRDYSEDQAIEIARRVLSTSRDQLGVLDFDDMLYMPLVHDVRFWKHSIVFVDEAQDTNAVQRALLKRMLKPGGRLVAIGDPRQAIYGFRGADSAAMSRIAEEFGAVELPLSVSYRCAKNIVAAAQEFSPEIEPSATAPDGTVNVAVIPHNPQDLDALYGRFASTDAVLCRNTAPLVTLAYSLMGAGKGCRILGREIGQGLVRLIDQMKAKDLAQLSTKLESYRVRETEKWTSRGREEKAQAVEDRVACIEIAAERLTTTDENPTVDALKAGIEKLFSDTDNGLLTLSTVHKAKGLEWEKVWIWRADLMPSPWARKDWQLEQERNLSYVAYTRAKAELNILYGEG